MQSFHILKKIRIFWLFPLILLTVLPRPSWAGTAAHDRALAAGFVSHKALYDITLSGTRSGSQIINIGGRMFYQWNADCEAWSSNHRFDLLYEYADTPPMRITSDFTTYESNDGKTMNFTSQRRKDGQLFEELRGSASLNAEGAGKAVYTRPDRLTFDLPEGSVFPTEHSLNVLEAIRKGNKFYKTVIFDGSDDQGPVEVNTFIGNPVKPLPPSGPGIDARLLNSPARNIRLAFFPLNETSPRSDYEMTLVFHENGIISDMLIEYHDFSVRQKLIALEPLAKACGNIKTGR